MCLEGRNITEERVAQIIAKMKIPGLLASSQCAWHWYRLMDGKVCLKFTTWSTYY